MVDGLAKQDSKRKDVDISISISKAEAKTKIWMEIMKKWQSNWDREGKGRHLYSSYTTEGWDREDHWKVTYYKGRG